MELLVGCGRLHHFFGPRGWIGWFSGFEYVFFFIGVVTHWLHYQLVFSLDIFIKITLFEDIKAQDQQVFKLCLLHCLQSQNDHRPRFSLQISGFFSGNSSDWLSFVPKKLLWNMFQNNLKDQGVYLIKSNCPLRKQPMPNLHGPIYRTFGRKVLIDFYWFLARINSLQPGAIVLKLFRSRTFSMGTQVKWMHGNI